MKKNLKLINSTNICKQKFLVLFFQRFQRRQGSSLDRPCLRREPNTSLDRPSLRREPNTSLDRPCLRREPNTSLDRRISSDRFSLDLPNISEHNILPSPTNRTSLDRPPLIRETNTSLDHPNISLDVPNISLDRPCLRREDSIYSAYTLTSMGYSLESEVGFQH